MIGFVMDGHIYECNNNHNYGEISRAAFIGMSWLNYAATFRGQQNFEVRRHFEEIR